MKLPKIVRKFQDGFSGFCDGFQLGVRQDGGSYTVLSANSLDNLNVSPKTAYWLYKKVSAVSDAVNKIAEPASVLPLAIKDDKADDLNMDVGSSELLTLLDNPQANVSGTQLLMEWLVSFLLTNEAWVVLAGSQRVVSMDFVKPYNVSMGFSFTNKRFPNEIKLSGKRYRDKVFKRFDESDGLIRYLADDGITELVGIINGTDDSDYRALSKLNAAVLDAKQYHLGSIHNAQLLANGARPTGIMVPKEGLSPVNFGLLESSMKEQFQGASNAGNVIITSVPMDSVNFNLNNRDMDYIKLIKLSKDMIYTTYNIPLAIVSSDKLTFSNVKESIPQLYVQAVLPAFQRFAKLFSFHLQHRFDELKDHTLWYNAFDIAQIQGLMLEKMKLMKDTQAFSDNEMRKETGHDPYEGGDIYYKPSSFVTVDEMRFGNGENKGKNND